MTVQETHNFKILREIIEDIRVAMLVTAENEPGLISRPVYTADIDSENNIWFFTKVNSGKVKEMMNDHHVTLSYTCAKAGKFLSVSGTASFSDNPKRLDDLFNIMIEAWFPKGPKDPDLLLIKVNPDQAEYRDTYSSKLAKLFRIIKAIAKEQVY